MLFTRSILPRRYQDYTRYRPFLRKGFRYRCAYCLTHEFFLGGEANFAIDHYRPHHGAFARPDLGSTYTNLYWCCNECNQNKADHYPNSEMELLGKQWIDPCEFWGDHDLHWHIDADGEVQWLTAAGEYTIKYLLFDRREWLKNHWRQMHALRQQHEAHNERLEKLKVSMTSKQYSDAEISEIQRLIENATSEIKSIRELLEPPVFDRPRATRT